MKRTMSSTDVHQAIRDALSLKQGIGPFATQRDIAAHYGISRITLGRWVVDYAGMSPREIETARSLRGTRHRENDAMPAITPKYAQTENRRGTPLIELVAWKASLRRKGRDYAKEFPFSRHGGRRVALLAAQLWCDRLMAKRRPGTKRGFATGAAANDSSGVSGVSEGYSVRVLRDGTVRKYRHWRAEKPKGLDRNLAQRQCKFSVARHGEQGARKLAIQVRQAWESELLVRRAA